MAKPYIVRDKYFQRAKQMNLRARSAFKLEEIQKKFKLIKAGDVVADLGAAPGSWSQMLSQWVEKGRVLALDLQEIEPLAKNVAIYQMDITDQKAIESIGIQNMDGCANGRVDGVVADLAPKTTGQHDVDAYHSAELNHAVLDFCEQYLKKNGYLITKIFQGQEFQEVVSRAKKLFKKVKCFKPPACRDRSRETYIIGQGSKK